MRFSQRLNVSLLSLAASDDLGIPNCESRSTSVERQSVTPCEHRSTIDESGGIVIVIIIRQRVNFGI